MTKKEKSIKSVKFWWHSINFGNGIVSPGVIKPKTHRIISSVIPNNLNGKIVLDIGAWDGYYSFECEKRGAKVLAMDNEGEAHSEGSRGFRTAKKILQSEVKYKKIDVYDIEKLGKNFDVILFFGVLYHLKHPFLALEKIHKITKELLILESHIIRDNSKAPLMKFYSKDELNKDPTNWWGPNVFCLKEMLKSVGFRKVKMERICGDRAILKAWK